LPDWRTQAPRRPSRRPAGDDVGLCTAQQQRASDAGPVATAAHADAGGGRSRAQRGGSRSLRDRVSPLDVPRRALLSPLMAELKRTELTVDREKAVLVGVILPDSTADPRDPLGELASLAGSAGAVEAARILQKRR